MAQPDDTWAERQVSWCGLYSPWKPRCPETRPVGYRTLRCEHWAGHIGQHRATFAWLRLLWSGGDDAA